MLNKVALTIELPSNAGSTAAAQKQLPILRNVVVSCEDQLAHWSRTNPPERNRKRERERERRLTDSNRQIEISPFCVTFVVVVVVVNRNVLIQSSIY